ncbi:MAG: hypothetical protein ACU0AT_11110 [Tranquillimonas sp.]
MPRRLLTAVCAALVLPAGAQAFVAENGLVVEPRADGSILVPYRGKSGLGDFWCAAADYVIRGENRPSATRIYRVSPPPRRSGEGIVFSLSPEGAANSGLRGLLSADAGISAAFGRLLCSDAVPERRR